MRRIEIAVSSCLLGHAVRYDGNHKRNAYLVENLARHADLIPVCPELAIGLGVPRPPIVLTLIGTATHAVGVDDPSLDVTAPLEAYGRTLLSEHATLSGLIVQNRSPSCGLKGVKRLEGGRTTRRGVGRFTHAVTTAEPLLPVIEAESLDDEALRDNFLERAFTYRRWQQLTLARLTPKRLLDFHSRHKLSLMAHSTTTYHELGRLVAAPGSVPISELKVRYITTLMGALGRPATRARQTNVLHHLMGYLKRGINGDDKAELNGVIDAYRRSELPLIAPLTLLHHHFRRHPHSYISGQYYLYPDDDERIARGR